jgi:hypothetical protein
MFSTLLDLSPNHPIIRWPMALRTYSMTGRVSQRSESKRLLVSYRQLEVREWWSVTTRVIAQPTAALAGEQVGYAALAVTGTANAARTTMTCKRYCMCVRT